MKSKLLATASGLTLVMATSALAADLPLKARPLEAAWSWAGPYIGLSVGAGRNRSGFYDLGDGTGEQLAFPPGEFWAPSRWRATFGGQAGYNWQFGDVVSGVEADINWLDGKSNAALAGFSPVFAATNMDWFATFRGRLGWAFSRTLIYVTGGLAVAHVSDQWGFPGQSPSFNYNDTRTAGVFGGGAEYMLTKNLTARVEGFYADFGTSPINTISGFSGNYRSDFTHTLTVVRGGVNWKW